MWVMARSCCWGEKPEIRERVRGDKEKRKERQANRWERRGVNSEGREGKGEKQKAS
jgi:hypothetical protein